MSKFDRPNAIHKKTKDKKLKSNLKRLDQQYRDTVAQAKATEYLLPEDAGYLEAEGMERTYKFSQDEIKKHVDVTTATKAFDLKLDQFGPYTLDYSRNGTHLLIGGQKGHVASMDWRKGELRTELNLGEDVHAVKYLQSEQYFAVAQKKYTFIYDHEGVELHRMKQHIDVRHLEFLPYHYLLATAGTTGWLKYQDVSTGTLVAELRTKLGPTLSMRQNPWNGVMHLGHGNGTVSLWAPNMSTPLVKMLTARGPVKALAIDRQGMYMATAGADKSLKIWDIRMFKELHNYYTPTPAHTLDISDSGMLAVGWGPHATVWKDVLTKQKQQSPYMESLFAGGRVNTVRYVPFEDFLGVGHSRGVTNMIVPGSGEANYDAFEINPFETAKQRQETEVRSLMNKLPADSISLDPNVIGTVDAKASAVRLTAKDLAELEEGKEKKINEAETLLVKPETKGKNSKLRKHLRKKKENVIDERKMRIERNLKREKEMRQRKKMVNEGKMEEGYTDLVDAALGRFK